MVPVWARTAEQRRRATAAAPSLGNARIMEGGLAGRFVPVLPGGG